MAHLRPLLVVAFFLFGGMLAQNQLEVGMSPAGVIIVSVLLFFIGGIAILSVDAKHERVPSLLEHALNFMLFGIWGTIVAVFIHSISVS